MEIVAGDLVPGLDDRTCFPPASGVLVPAIAASIPTQVASAPSHSDTNNQVQGVDEGDIVENDGNALYILSGSDLKIIDARNPDALTVASTTAIDGQPIAEYLNGTHLTIISSTGGYDGVRGPFDDVPGVWPRVGIGPMGLGGSTHRGGPIPVDMPVLPTAVPNRGVAAVAAIPLRATEGSAPRRSAGEGHRARRLRPGRPRPWCGKRPSMAPMPARGRSATRSTSSSRTISPYLSMPQTLTDGDAVRLRDRGRIRARLAAIVADLVLPRSTAEVTGQSPVGRRSGRASTSIYKPESPGEQSLFTVLTFDAGKTDAGPAGAVGVVASSVATVYATPEHLDLFSLQGQTVYLWSVCGDGHARGPVDVDPQVQPRRR